MKLAYSNEIVADFSFFKIETSNRDFSTVQSSVVRKFIELREIIG